MINANEDSSSKLCQACELNPVEATDLCDDDSQPYEVCHTCQQRLQDYTLRPLEWYNLTKRHGRYQELLEDDVYTGLYPGRPLHDAEDYPSPTMSEICNSPETLLDYSIVCYPISAAIRSAWKAYPPEVVLPTAINRFTGTQKQYIREACLQVIATTHSGDGAEFVRSCWKAEPLGLDLIPLAEASAACLPHGEGFDKVCHRLANIPDRTRYDNLFALAYFHSAETLDWIERSIFGSIKQGWGELAAVSDLDWQRVEKWLASGRPLSLVAIDALQAVMDPRRTLLEVGTPSLRNPPTTETYTQTLKDYLQRDSVPRVQKLVGSLLKNTESIVQKSSQIRPFAHEPHPQSLPLPQRPQGRALHRLVHLHGI